MNKQKNKSTTIRAIFDSGSTQTYITKRLFKALGLEKDLQFTVRSVLAELSVWVYSMCFSVFCFRFNLKVSP
ncbi:uncharacterized protein LOC103510600 isoform X5 [Diaphorina citri]|uniref:Uncharacterized protein LOC103510600 isoform X5 n=1 Tax=Diaphorina citri TaxID=121845 RepID=A0A3Q0IVY6_DIACI|nr:uncharacterized protein LOC103510600 isoform X5 [Diaphorina citri]